MVSSDADAGGESTADAHAATTGAAAVTWIGRALEEECAAYGVASADDADETDH